MTSLTIEEAKSSCRSHTSPNQKQWEYGKVTTFTKGKNKPTSPSVRPMIKEQSRIQIEEHKRNRTETDVQPRGTLSLRGDYLH